MAPDAGEGVLAVEVGGVGLGDLGVDLLRPLRFAQGVEGPRRPIAAAAGAGVLGIEGEQLGPVAHAAGVVLPAVLPPAELPEVGGAGGVPRIDAAQPPQHVDGAVEEAGVLILGVERLESAGLEIGIGAGLGHPFEAQLRVAAQFLAVGGAQIGPAASAWTLRSAVLPPISQARASSCAASSPVSSSLRAACTSSSARGASPRCQARLAALTRARGRRTEPG